MRSTSARACSGIGGLDLEVDHPPDPRAVDAEAEMLQRVLHGLALRIEDSRLGPDEDGRLHCSTVVGAAA